MKKFAYIGGVLFAAAGAFTLVNLSGCNESSLSQLQKSGNAEQKDQSSAVLISPEPSNVGEAVASGTSEKTVSLHRGYVVNTVDPNLAFLAQNNVSGRHYVTKDEAKAYISAAGETPIRLKGSSFLLMPDVTPVLSKQSEYVYLQLNQGLNADIERELATNAVRLANYVGSNTWVVNLNQAQVDQLAGKEFVYAIGMKDLKDKVSPEILANGVYERSEAGDYHLLVGLYDGDTDLPNVLLKSDLIQSPDSVKKVGKRSYEVAVSTSSIQSFLQLNEIAWVEDKPLPNEGSNTSAGALSGVDEARRNFGLMGDGIVVGIWDGGRVDTHRDFDQRLVNREAVTVDISEHATHVAGTMVGAGGADGMAPLANIEAYNWTDDGVEMRAAAEANEIVLSNHSYGTITGWNWQRVNRNSPWEWVWRGWQSNFGNYNQRASDWDEIVFDTDLIIFKAAGNDRDDTPSTATPAEPADGGSTGFDTIPTYGNAKNIVTVGAVTDQRAMSRFSGWGPADDGRIKPDLVASGVSVRSTVLNGRYESWNGTSMATPVVSGGAALFVEDYLNFYGLSPSAATAKAFFIHTAQDLGRVGPDYEFGWGLFDLASAIEHLRLGTGHHQELQVNNETVEEITYQINNADEFTVTLVWTDPAASSNSNSNLVHDLDVRLVAPNGVVHLPWVLDAENPDRSATRGINDIDNVEQVLVLDPVPGTWTLRVSGRNIVGSQIATLVSSQPRDGVDSDNDWIEDSREFEFGTEPFNRDSDDDGLTDYQEVCFDGNCTEYKPFIQGRDTDANKADTDHDNVSDRDEINAGRSPILNEPALISIISGLLN